MRVIAWRTLREFASQQEYKGALKPLTAWRQLIKASLFVNPHELKEAFPKVSILTSGLVVFNIGGNKYRLVASIAYRTRIVYVKWIGTHEDYDKLDLG
jgi:mRNA interferase HigB